MERMKAIPMGAPHPHPHHPSNIHHSIHHHPCDHHNRSGRHHSTTVLPSCVGTPRHKAQQLDYGTEDGYHGRRSGQGQFLSRSHSNESRSSGVRSSESFYVKEPPLTCFDLRKPSNNVSTYYYGASNNSGFRSLNAEAANKKSNALFSDGDDDDHPPLQMSSIDGVSTQVIKRRAQSGGDIIDTIDDDLDAIENAIDPQSNQFSLSTPHFKKSSPNLVTETSHNTTFDSIGMVEVNKEKDSKSSSSGSHSITSFSSVAQSNPYSSLRTKLKNVQEKYKKSSVTNKFRSKFQTKTSSIEVDPGKMSKYRSHSHGALHNLDDFEQMSGSREASPAKIIDKQPEVTTVTIETPLGSSKAMAKPPGSPGSSDYDQDSGILHEMASDTLSSGSDSGFYHTNEDKSNVGSPRYSTCSSRCSSKSSSEKDYEVKKKKSLKQNSPNANETQAVSSRRSLQRIERRHSRASSVDRREIFQKYIQNVNEHAESLRPYVNEDTELKNPAKIPAMDGQVKNIKQSVTPANTQLAGKPAKPVKSTSPSPNLSKEFRLVRLKNLNGSDLGIFIARNIHADIGCPGYYVAYVLANGLVAR